MDYFAPFRSVLYFSTLIAPIVGILAAMAGLWVQWKAAERRTVERQRKIDAVEERVLAEPGKPQLAWDLARAKLEDYLDRNLSQVRYVLVLTYAVMFAGFVLVLIGLYRSFESQSDLKVAVVGSASGVIVSFIGGSFLLVYKSVLAQTKDYVAVLERINAVGMAVQVLSGIPDDQAELKHKTTAQLASDLIKLYATSEQKAVRKNVPVSRRAKTAS